MRRLLTFALDVALVGLATVLSVFLRDDLAPTVQHLTGIGVYLLAGIAVAIVVLPSVGVSRTIWRFSGIDDAVRIGAAAAVIVAISVGIGFVIDRLEHVPRSLPLIQFILIVALQISVRVFSRVMYSRRARRKLSQLQAGLTARVEAGGPPPKSVLVVGVGDLADLFLRTVATYAPARIRVEGVLGRQERHVGRVIDGVQVLGTPEQLPLVLAELELRGVNIDKVIVAEPFQMLSEEAREAILTAERQLDVQVELLSETFGLGREERDAVATSVTLSVPAGKSSNREGQQRALYSLTEEQLAGIVRRPYWLMKRAFDVVLALLLILVLAPVMLAVAAAVALELGGPVVFWQKRPGQGGLPIKVFKFRSMRGLHDQDGRRLSDAERAAPVATWLRQHRLDELPQLFNILMGQMSFIGPRPLLPVDQAAGHPRLLVRPGLTGWAQVNGGRALSVEDKCALDLWYVQNASLRVDFTVVLRTVRVLLRGEERDERAIEQARMLAVPSAA